MSAAEVLIAIGLVPAYVALRSLYHRMPLHIDTGFYVSNDSITAKRWTFRRGWNARFAGCSKLVPEWFFTKIFLSAQRRCAKVARPKEGRTDDGSAQARSSTDFVVGDSVAAGCAYARNSRAAVSAVNVLGAVSAALLGGALAADRPFVFLAVFLAYLMLSAEPHLGAYFECAEPFEAPCQALSVWLLLFGFSTQRPSLVCGALALWTASSCWIKLSSLAGIVPLLGATLYYHPPSALPAAACCIAVLAIFLLWIRSQGRDFREFFGPLSGHEKAFRGAVSWLALLRLRCREKLQLCLRAAFRQPIVPVLALCGIPAMVRAAPPIIWAYAAAIAVIYFLQAAQCRYYAILGWPIAAIAAGIGGLELIAHGWKGAALVAVLLGAWVYSNVIRPARWNADALHRWVWRAFQSDWDVQRNRILAESAPRIAQWVKGRTLLVYGPTTQAYVLVGSSWPTPIISPDRHLDDMRPEWQVQLNAALVESPPEFVLDSDACFDARLARTELGLDYRLCLACGDMLRLFRLCERTNSAPGLTHESISKRESRAVVRAVLDFQQEPRTGEPSDSKSSAARFAAAPIARTYRPLTREQLADQERNSDVVERIQSEFRKGLDPVSAAITKMLDALCDQGRRRIAIYGAGRFTARHCDSFRRSDVQVAVVFDDDASVETPEFLGWPTRRLESNTVESFDAILISSDRYAIEMQAKAQRMFADQVPVVTLSAG